MSYAFHCTRETPYRGHGVNDGTAVLHQHSSCTGGGRRRCDVCNTDLGLDFERQWERDKRVADEAQAKARATGPAMKRAPKAPELPASE